jgi:hypothetical protein
VRSEQHRNTPCISSSAATRCRRAQVESVVTRSISGHATERMKQHYETVNVEEKRQSLARVISLAGFREAFLRDGVGAPESAAEEAGEAA